MHRTLWRMLAVLFAVVLIGSACSSDDDDDSSSDDSGDDSSEEAGGDGGDGGGGLDEVMSADVLKCGTRDALPGFAVLTEDGDHVGFDNDFCRAIAAGILGDAEKIEFVDLETDDRFTALQSGEVDVLVRNTTWTSGRDGTEAATFLQPNFYDGQGMMVRADSGFTTLADLNGAVICSAGGTTSEGNIVNEFARQGLEAPEVLSFEDTDLLQEAFVAGRCDGWTSDVSQLTGLRSEFPEGPDSLIIMDEVFSKEPLAPAVVDGEDALAQAVNWAVFATIQAEEFGIDSANVDDFLDSDDPNVALFLGVESEGAVFNPGLGLPDDFNYQVIKQVGNYSEIYDEHITPLGLDRGLNSLWNEGGQLYAPPYR